MSIVIVRLFIFKTYNASKAINTASLFSLMTLWVGFSGLMPFLSPNLLH